MAAIDVDINDPQVAKGLDDLLRTVETLDEMEERKRQVRHYIGDEAWPYLLDLVERLQYADADEVTYDHANPAKFDSDKRQSLRMLGCLIGLVHDDIPSSRIPILLCHLIDNANLTLNTIKDACEGRGGVDGIVQEVRVATLRLIAVRRLNGEKGEDIKKELGVGWDTINKVSSMLCAQEALRQRDREHVRDAVEQGMSVRATARSLGWGHNRCHKLMQEVAQEGGVTPDGPMGAYSQYW